MMKKSMYPMRRRLITTGLFVGALALGAAACGSGGEGVQARQTGDTSATTAQSTTTTGVAPSTTDAPATTTAPSAPAPPQPPCTVEGLTSALTAKFGPPTGVVQVQACAAGWATSSTKKGFDPPVFTLYRAEGDHWVALDRSAGKLCAGQGVPTDVARQIGCDS